MSLAVKEHNRTVEKIVVKYSDGTEREVDRGMVVIDESDFFETSLSFQFLNIDKEALEDIIIGVYEVGEELGIFED